MESQKSFFSSFYISHSDNCVFSHISGMKLAFSIVRINVSLIARNLISLMRCHSKLLKIIKISPPPLPHS